MSMRTFLFALLVLTGVSVMSPTTVQAETFTISVSRVVNNLYRIDGKDIMIHTRECEVDGYSAESVLTATPAGRGDLLFKQTKEKCEVEGVYDATQPKSGKYGVVISRVETDWFEVAGSHLFLKTEARCLLMAVSEPVTLEVYGKVGGYLIFPSGKKCKVTGIYNRAKV